MQHSRVVLVVTKLLRALIVKRAWYFYLSFEHIRQKAAIAQSSGSWNSSSQKEWLGEKSSGSLINSGKKQLTCVVGTAEHQQLEQQQKKGVAGREE